MTKSFLLGMGALLFVVTGTVTESAAEVNVHVGVNLPVVRFSAPPEVVVIPGTYVYMVPGIDADVLFYQGYWWRPYQGHWYRSRDYRGKWIYAEPGRIPRGLRSLPQDYRHRLSSDHDRIPHRDVKKNWKKWEKEKKWDKRDGRGHSGRDRQGPPGHDRQGPSERGDHDRGRR